MLHKHWDNRPISLILQCTCPISHNAPFRTERCTFLFWMVHCGIWDRCIVGFVNLVYCIIASCQLNHLPWWHKSVSVNCISIVISNGLYTCSLPSHYLHKWRLIINWDHRNKLQWNSNQSTNLFVCENAFANAVCEMAAILSRGKSWVTMSRVELSNHEGYGKNQHVQSTTKHKMCIILQQHFILWSNRIRVPFHERFFPLSCWCHQMETFSALLALCAGNSPVISEFPAQWQVMQSFDAFFDLCLNKRLSKQSWGWWFEKPSCSLWRLCIVIQIQWKIHSVIIPVA